MKKNVRRKKKKNKLRSYSLVILPDKTKIIFSYSNLRYLTKKQYLYLTNNRKKDGSFFEPSFNSLIRCMNSDYFRVLCVGRFSAPLWYTTYFVFAQYFSKSKEKLRLKMSLIKHKFGYNRCDVER